MGYWSLEDGSHIKQSLPGIDGSWTRGDDYERSFANAADHIINLLNGAAENYSSGREVARSLEIIVGFYVSYYTGATVDIP